MSRLRIATVWLTGCSGCHMSLLDTDEWLLELARRVELVYSPLVDAKTFPDGVDVTIIEGAIGSREEAQKVRLIRAKSRLVVSLGDCAVTGNVPAMRNPIGTDAALREVYRAGDQPSVPADPLLPSLERVRPVHHEVRVDVFVPGCPPAAPVIRGMLEAVLAGRVPDIIPDTRFGA